MHSASHMSTESTFCPSAIDVRSFLCSNGFTYSSRKLLTITHYIARVVAKGGFRSSLCSFDILHLAFVAVLVPLLLGSAAISPLRKSRALDLEFCISGTVLTLEKCTLCPKIPSLHDSSGFRLTFLQNTHYL